MKYNIIIVDDEQPARKLLESYVSKISYLNLLGSFKSPIDALAILKIQKVDILLLDIRMPEISGLDFLKTIDNSSLSVILTTAYREYALDGYEHNITDYLLKPIEFSRFLKAINKVDTTIKNNNFEISNESPSEYIHLKNNKRTYRLSTDSILFIEGENEYVNYYINNGKKLLIYGTLKSIEEKLSDLQFCRIHRSYIINLNAIDFVEGNIVVINDKKIPISSSYKKAFFQKWK